MDLTIKNVVFDEERPKICVPLTEATEEALFLQAEQAEQSVAEIVEWRVDLFQDVEDTDAVLDVLAKLRSVLKEKLLLFTFRSKEEGGDREFSLKKYQTLYEAVVASGQADLIDIELARAEFLGRHFVQQIKDQNLAVIMSSHDFDKTPSDGALVMKIRMMAQFGADIGKIAVMPQTIQDVLRLMGLSVRVQAFDTLPLALISMGELGKITRVSGSLIKSVLTFGALDKGSAPGQLPVEQLAEILKWLNIEKSGSETIG